jgi:2-phosphoglycolate phosphatase
MKPILAGVLFDLDGTLLDTAPDLATALNIVLQQQGRTPLPLSQIRPWCSEGSKGLLKLGFDINDQHPNFPQLRSDFLHAYQQHIHENTVIFSGMLTTLHYLVGRHIPWGIVTNKPITLARELLSNFELPGCQSLVGGDSLATRKPDPEPLLYACQQLGCAPVDCVYIGDAHCDIEAAKRAEMHSIAALYGYRLPDDQPQHWHADFYIDSPRDIIPLLEILFG